MVVYYFVFPFVDMNPTRVMPDDMNSVNVVFTKFSKFSCSTRAYP